MASEDDLDSFLEESGLKANEPEVEPLYLGFDFSTQRVKGVAVDEKCRVLFSSSVHFDSELPEYRTNGGVNITVINNPRSQSGQTKQQKITAPSIMWVKALDILMEKLRLSGLDFSRVRAVSGCGQQHGSVYWRTGARDLLKNSDPGQFLHQELAHAFSVLDSPVWMDASTTHECRRLEELIGGPQALADITGSRAYERFTGNQIAKIFVDRNEAYTNTERISLVSSFAATLFLGDYAPCDYSDAAGMNLLDIRTKDWDQDCLDCCGVALKEKLGAPVSSRAEIGKVSPYMVERYGFDESCSVCAFTGDNPASLVGMRMGPADLGFSLGTSDTAFVWLRPEEQLEPEEDGLMSTTAASIVTKFGIRPQTIGHIWPNPVNPDHYMALLCYKNGSLTRERVCSEIAENSWDIFNQLLDSTPRGNFGNIGMYFDLAEITPDGIQGDFRFNKVGDRVARFASAEAEVRACVEGQIMAKRIHAEQMGFRMEKNRTRIFVCGGASRNAAILQVISDVFQAPVFIHQDEEVSANFASLGSAIQAIKSTNPDWEPPKDLSFSNNNNNNGGEGEERISKEEEIEWKKMCVPHKDAGSVYKPLMERYRQLERKIIENFKQTTQ